MRLFIAEKPQLGKIIADALGGGRSQGGYIQCGDDVVTWCVGHLLQLVSPEEINPSYSSWKKEDLPLKLRPHRLKPIERTAEQFQVVERLIGQASEIVHAGDPDDEGQLLVDEVLVYCNNRSPVKRVLINDLNVNKAKKAILDLKDNSEFKGVYLKALARSIADQLYGFNMTRAYTLAGREKGVDKVLSVGRVQTPVLALIVNRYLESKNHNASFYYDIFADMSFSGKKVVGKLNLKLKKNWQLNEAGRLTDMEMAEEAVSSCKGSQALVLNKQFEEKETLAPLPFSLLDLQVQMSNQHNISSDRTLEITQDLRDKFKAITYNRSDCSYLNEEQYKDSPEIIEVLTRTITDYGKLKSAGAIDSSLKSRAFNEAETTAHTAIIPTSNVPKRENLTDEEWKVYDAIALQFLAQFMPAKKYESISVSLVCGKSSPEEEGYQYDVRATKTVSAGWTSWLRSSATDDAEEKTASSSQEGSEDATVFKALDELQINDAGMCENIVVKQEKTKPKPLYTEATLLKDLQRIAKYVKDPRIKQLLISRDKGKVGENGGIGTPATRSNIIKVLRERNFYQIEKKKLIPTELGISFIKLLPELATAPDMTALWHEQQLMIEKGELTVDDFLDELEIFIAGQVATADVSGIKIDRHSCECGGFYKQHKGEHGLFWGCSNYPACKNSLPDNNGKPNFKANIRPEIKSKCPKCGSRIAVTSKMCACTGCDFRLYPIVFQKTLSLNQVENLLTNFKLPVVKGLIKNNGDKFEAALILNKTTWRIEPDFSVPKVVAKKKVVKRF